MKADDKEKSLDLKIRRVRTRLAAGVRTGSDISALCKTRTDPTYNGTICPTLINSGCSSHPYY